MESSPISIRVIFYTAAFSIIIVAGIIFKNIIDNRTTIVFCDVGQGDGTYIRIRNKVDVIIDAGPDNSILKCLGEHMPFYDRTVELAFITHPQKDHYFGFIEIGKRYQINNLFMNPINSKNESFQTLLRILEEKHTTVFFPYEGTKIESTGAAIEFLWPTKKLILNSTSRNTETFKYQNSGTINKYLGETELDPNEFSLVFKLREDNISALFTGDASPGILHSLSQNKNIKVNILKVPHHGSKNGLNREFLELADPRVSVISVAKNNRYGHPSREIAEMFKELKLAYITTADEGSITFKLSGSAIERVY